MALAREVGLCVRALRQRRGLTQATLAERIDSSEVALRAIERGASAPSFVTLERLARALEVPPAALFPAAEIGSAAERRARVLARVAALAHSLADRDLTMALEILDSIARHCEADGSSTTER